MLPQPGETTDRERWSCFFSLAPFFQCSDAQGAGGMPTAALHRSGPAFGGKNALDPAARLIERNLASAELRESVEIRSVVARQGALRAHVPRVSG